MSQSNNMFTTLNVRNEADPWSDDLEISRRERNRKKKQESHKDSNLKNEKSQFVFRSSDFPPLGITTK